MSKERQTADSPKVSNQNPNLHRNLHNLVPRQKENFGLDRTRKLSGHTAAELKLLRTREPQPALSESGLLTLSQWGLITLSELGAHIRPEASHDARHRGSNLDQGAFSPDWKSAVSSQKIWSNSVGDRRHNPATLRLVQLAVFFLASSCGGDSLQASGLQCSSGCFKALASQRVKRRAWGG